MQKVYTFTYRYGIVLMYFITLASELMQDLGFYLLSFAFMMLSGYLLIRWYYEGKLINDTKEYKEGLETGSKMVIDELNKKLDNEELEIKKENGKNTRGAK